MNNLTRLYLKTEHVATFLVALFAFSVASLSATENKPNVLFIVVDDLNDWVGAYGNKQAKTPNLDRFAESSTRFELAMSSTPLCNPSRTAVLTGLPAYVTGIYENDHWFRDFDAYEDWVTLPQYFREFGYRTYAGGKVYHKASGKASDPQSWNEVYHDKTGTKAPPDSRRWQHGMKGEFALDYYNKAIDWATLDTPKEETYDWKTAEKAAKILEQDSNDPFFLAVGIFRPHLPWYAPKEYFDLYPLDEVEVPEITKDDLSDVGPTGRKMAGGQAHSIIQKHGKWKEAVRAYLACVSYADDCIGEVLDALDSSPHKSDTIVVIWGDHGFHLGEKEHWEKYTLWERANRTPLFIRVPGIADSGDVATQPVSLIDLHKTLIELADLPAREEVYGRSLVPLLTNPLQEWETPALMTHYPNNHAVRDERYRYIRYADGFEELYDHDEDPKEFTNIASEEGSREIMERLAKEIPKMNAGWPDHKRTFNQH